MPLTVDDLFYGKCSLSLAGVVFFSFSSTFGGLALSYPALLLHSYTPHALSFCQITTLSEGAICKFPLPPNIVRCERAVVTVT